MRPRGAAAQRPALLSKVQLVVAAEDSVGVGGVVRDNITNGFSPLDFTGACTASATEGGGGGGGGDSKAAAWLLTPMRGQGGAIWYRDSAGPMLSFSLYTDERAAWRLVMPALLGGTVRAGRGHDTALFDAL